MTETNEVNGASIGYTFAGDTVTATLGDDSDSFDFAGLPEGGGIEDIVTTLPVNPILSATRTAGVLTVTLLRWYDETEDPGQWPKVETV